MGPNVERLVKILDVIVYLFVDTYVPIVYRVMSSSTKSTTLAFTDIGFQKNLSKWNQTPKGSSIFGNARAYLFVGTIVTIVYRIKSSSTKSTIITPTDVGPSKIFKNGTERRKARRILDKM
jgi:archaellum component FlaF (FlaF/FlaG flagellin family)